MKHWSANSVCSYSRWIKYNNNNNKETLFNKLNATNILYKCGEGGEQILFLIEWWRRLDSVSTNGNWNMEFRKFSIWTEKKWKLQWHNMYHISGGEKDQLNASDAIRTIHSFYRIDCICLNHSERLRWEFSQTYKVCVQNGLCEAIFSFWNWLFIIINADLSSIPTLQCGNPTSKFGLMHVKIPARDEYGADGQQSSCEMCANEFAKVHSHICI